MAKPIDFTAPSAVQRILGIYSLLQKESMTAYDLSNVLCISRAATYLYLRHMEEVGYIVSASKIYSSVPAVKLPVFIPSRLVCNDDEDGWAKKLKKQADQIKPFRDPMLFLFSKT